MNIHEHGFWPSVGCERSHLCSAKLAGWLARYLDRSVPTHDFGCGLGTYLLALQEVGFQDLHGYEGDPPLAAHFKSIEQRDLTFPVKVEKPGNVICLEVAEHIPDVFSGVLVDSLVAACSDRMVMSWAVRGQGGQGHVNELDAHEVLPRFLRRGFVLQEAETEEARKLAGSDLGWFRNSLFVLRLSQLSHLRESVF